MGNFPQNITYAWLVLPKGQSWPSDATTAALAVGLFGGTTATAGLDHGDRELTIRSHSSDAIVDAAIAAIVQEAQSRQLGPVTVCRTQGERTEHFQRENDAATRDTYIRNLDNDLYHQIRVAAVNRRMAIGTIINEAMRMWLAAQPKEQSAL